MTLTSDVQARLDAHLDAVERALLAAGCARERRRGVVDDLEAQIRDMLAAKSEVPTVAELEEVLGRLDPPAAYGAGGGAAAAGAEAAGVRTAATAAGATVTPVSPAVPAAAAARSASPVRRPRYSRTAIWGLVCILLSLVPIPLLMVVAVLFVRHTVVSMPARAMPIQPIQYVGAGPEATTAPAAPAAPVQAMVPSGGMKAVWGVGGLAAIIFILMVPLAITGTVLGWVAFVQIRGSGGALCGTPIALFDGLFYPVLMMIGSVVTPFFLPVVMLVMLAMGIAVVWIVIRLAMGKPVLG